MNAIWDWKLYHADNEKWEKKNNKTTQQVKHKNITRNNYIYIGLLQADTIKQMGTKEEVRKEYLRRTRKAILQQKSNQR